MLIADVARRPAGPDPVRGSIRSSLAPAGWSAGFGERIEPQSIVQDDSAVVAIENIIVEPPGEGVIIDPMGWFDSPGPFELEIGCGKGGFLLSRARAHPEIRLLGIEWANKYFRNCADRMARWGLSNVRVMRTDAKYFVIQHLPARCVSVLHLYHPDPWPKKRHHKRRLVQDDLVEAAVRVLTPEGRWLVQSDHEEYFIQIRDLLGRRLELTEVAWDEAAPVADPEWRGTNYEIKYGREGRVIYRAAYCRREARGVPAIASPPRCQRSPN